MVATPLVLLAVASSVSIAACLAMMACFLLFEESRRCGRRILFYLNATDLCGAILWLLTLLPSISDPDNPDDIPLVCFIQGYGLQFCLLSSYLWTSCFAFHLYQILVKTNKTPEMYEWRYILLSWGIPLIIVAMFAIQHLCGFVLIGFGGLPWCWIRSWSANEWALDGYVLQMLFFYAPLMVALCFNVTVFVFVANKLGRTTVMSSGMEDKIRRRMMAYTAVFLATFAWGALGRTFQVISPGHAISPAFLSLTAFFSPLQGALNCLTYGLNKLLRERIRQAFDRWWRAGVSSGAPKATGEKRTLVPSPKRVRRA
ncbi:hypothetical protein ACHHYP_00504 [Achlya hypogyna]|uniref:G-protein coupled receptors family 2 profile 2 domain-containing protein n=1 Tax=Achlya hypogyna TaxID=1202772 RepID=A0A1V9ZAL5_ACHHY|nr:hypothetical protein ACHHYP_00504 [Achlya hypogyna]